MEGPLHVPVQTMERLEIGFFHTDGNHEIDHWSREMERITGYTAEDIVGNHTCEAVLACVDDHGVRRCHRGCPLTTGLSGEVTFYPRHKSGYRLPVTLRFDHGQSEATGCWVGCGTIQASHQGLPRHTDDGIPGWIDALTGLPNRTMADRFLIHLEQLYGELGVPYGLVIFDIDRFRHFNDQYGHDAGDEMLRVLAKTLTHSIDARDFTARWGGEELILFFPGGTREVALRQAERLKQLMDASVLPHDEHVLKVTVSGGVTLRKPGDNLGSLLYRADEGIYLAKKHGRNQIHYFE